MIDIDILELPDPEPPKPSLIDCPDLELTEPRDYISIVLVQPRRDQIDHPDRIDHPDLADLLL